MIVTAAEAPSENDTPYQSTLRDMIMLETPMAVKVSPGSRRVTMGIRTTNWKENRHDTVCHVHRAGKYT